MSAVGSLLSIMASYLVHIVFYHNEEYRIRRGSKKQEAHSISSMLIIGFFC